MLVLPGTYRVRLTVDGQSQESTLRVVQDPRSKVPESEMKQALVLSKFIAGRLSKARQAYGEMQFMRAQISAATDALQARHASTDALAAQMAVLQGLDKEPGLNNLSKVLSGIESDLEDADRGPNQPQLDVAHEHAALIDKRCAEWNRVRLTQLAALNQIRVAAGLPAVVIPAPDLLEIEPAESGEDLP